MTPAPFSLLAKPTGAICNLDCDYCYFLSKDQLYPGDRFRMTDEVLESYIIQMLAAHPMGPVTIAWQGGEPTLRGLDFFRRSVELAERHRSPGQRVSYSIQTNGTLLDDDWGAFLAEHQVLVGISIDGPRHLHDAHRKTKKGDGTFDRVIAGLRLLQRHNVAVNVLCTVNATNQDHPLDVYRFFRDELEVQFLQFIPIVERTTDAFLPLANLGWGEKRPLYTQSGDRVTDRSVDAEAFGRFLTTIFDEWVAQDVGRVFVQHFDVALAGWHGVPGGLCIFSETCGSALALEHNGDVYSCDHYVEPDYLLGNIAEAPLRELTQLEQQTEFGRAKESTLPTYCRNCEVRFACNGGCPKNRFISTPDDEAGLNYLCAGYKHFFNHIDAPMRQMSRLIADGRPAAHIMDGTT